MHIGILYGGSSPEYEISLQSAQTIIQNLDTSKFTLVPIHITPQSQWIVYDNQLLSSSDSDNKPKIYSTIPNQLPCDVIFSVLHGRLGEDGAMQGLFNIMDLPYVGSDILSSAIGMNKVLAKQLVAYHQAAPIVPYWDCKLYHWQNDPIACVQQIENQLTYPLFVKPVNAGSSIGVTRVAMPDALSLAIEHAFQYDSHIMIESAMNADEIEVAVLESLQYGHPPLVSTAGAIIPQQLFYSYEAKYCDKAGATLEMPANISDKQLNRVQAQAHHIFELLQCEGMARIDFFLDRTTHEFYFNEINTLPGFTEISMYPQLWQLSGKSLSDLLTHLIQLAIKRHHRQLQLKRFR